MIQHMSQATGYRTKAPFLVSPFPVFFFSLISSPSSYTLEHVFGLGNDVGGVVVLTLVTICSNFIISLVTRALGSRRVVRFVEM